MHMVLIGPPGAGKGTQAAVLSERLGVAHISTGDLFRDHVARRTPLGEDARKYLDAGDLVPDHITSGMVRQRLAETDTRGGFLLDGFPRTVRQADELSLMLSADGRSLDAVVELSVPEDIVVERLLNRGRADDTEEVILHRQRLYREQTAPLLDHYADLLLTIHGVGSVQEVARRVLEALPGRPTRPVPLC
jgi:adenylate kinase